MIPSHLPAGNLRCFNMQGLSLFMLRQFQCTPETTTNSKVRMTFQLFFAVKASVDQVKKLWNKY